MTPPDPPSPEPSAALRAQLLATEHWSLLATRSTTQSEVLVRIGMLLTFVSAVLVSLALVGQATGFDGNFRLVAVVLLAIASVIGVLTQVRVQNVAMEDLALVLAMNRLRAAYAELVPGLERDFLASTHDDLAGVSRTYYFLGPPRDLSQVLGSSMVFVTVVVATLVGLLTASIVLVLGGATALAVALALVVGLAAIALSVGSGYRAFSSFWRGWQPRNPTPGE
ncbi:hypothetical protein [Desertivibrio insolitus]|uniref:hypothetical protein n=1 Tax=Herbiconiux sp. SYSU D00978 TaxID=2812562 RepID=UPI001A97761A|nr:hypothetical protein [Herbiconiux sp. SYSU D00978]